MARKGQGFSVELLAKLALGVIVLVVVAGLISEHSKQSEEGLSVVDDTISGMLVTQLRTPEELVSAIQCSYARCYYSGATNVLDQFAGYCKAFSKSRVSLTPECDCRGALSSIPTTLLGCEEIKKYRYVGDKPVTFYSNVRGKTEVLYSSEGINKIGDDRKIMLPDSTFSAFSDYFNLLQAGTIASSQEAYQTFDWKGITLAVGGLDEKDFLHHSSDYPLTTQRKAIIYPGAELTIISKQGSEWGLSGLLWVGTLVRQTNRGDGPECGKLEFGSPLTVSKDYGHQCVLKAAEKCLKEGPKLLVDLKAKSVVTTQQAAAQPSKSTASAPPLGPPIPIEPIVSAPCYTIKAEEEGTEYPLFFKEYLLTLGGDGEAPFVWDATKRFDLGSRCQYTWNGDEFNRDGLNLFLKNQCYWRRSADRISYMRETGSSVRPYEPIQIPSDQFDSKYASLTISSSKGIQMEYVKISDGEYGILLHPY